MAESRVEDLLETGVEQPVLPMSEIEAILRGEPVTPHSRIAELLLKYNPSDILIEKRITENGTYFATNDNADGYYKVVVDEYVPTLIFKEVTANGTYDPAVDGADGYSSIRVNLPLEHQIGEVFNQNGLYHVTPSQGYEGISRADIMVQVNPVLETKTIDANGTYTPSQGYDGFSEVTVDVPGQNADLALRCVGLDGYSVTITSADNSETYTKSVTGSPATITFDNLAYVGNWTVSNTKDSTTVTVSNAVSNEDYKLYTQQIPRMTAYDQPSGVISASSEFDDRFLAWFAAANNGGSGGNGWMGASMNSYLIYQFAAPVIFSKLYFRIADVWGFNYYNIREYGNDIDVLGSVDGTTYERCTSTGSTVNKKGYGDVNIDLNGKKYKYLKVIVPKATFSRDYYNCGVMNLMLYSDPEATAYMLGSKSITANGTYNPASDGLDAFSEVTVNVPLPQNALLLKDIPSTPTAIATFSDGAEMVMPSLTVGVEAVQDLHGYDSPWVGGAGKNKLPLSVSEIKSSNGGANSWTNNSKEISGIVYTILTDSDENVIGIKANGTATANSILYLMSTTAPPIQLDGQSVIISMAGFSKGDYKDNSWHDIWTPSTESAVTLNGDVVQMWGQINNGVQVNNIVIQPMIRLASVTDASFAPYSNICPIIGYTEANVTRTGKNLFDKDSTTVVNDKVRDDNGAEVNSSGTCYTSSITAVKPNTTYVLNGLPSTPNVSFRIYYLDANGNWLSRTNTINFNSQPYSFTTPNNCGGLQFQLGKANTDFSATQLEIGTTPTAYEPYAGTTYTIDLNGTRYGGKVDVVNGTMTVDRASVDMGDLYWNYGSSSKVFTASVSGIKSGTYTDENLISSIYPVTPLPYSQFEYGLRYDSPTSIGVKNPLYTDATAFKTAMSGVQLVYELATPLTIQLTPTAVKSLDGINNIFADSGEILEGEYLAK